MKLFTVRLVLAFTLTFAIFTVQAQTDPAPTLTPPPTSTGSFWDSVTGYFSSFNTNLDSTFADSKASIWTGMDSIQGAHTPLANALGISYRVYDLVSLESVTRNAGVAGTVVSEQFGPSLNFIVHDTRLSLYAHAGYELDAPSGSKLADKIYGEIGVRISKALTAHTFAGVGIGGQFPKNTQVFSAFAGFVF